MYGMKRCRIIEIALHFYGLSCGILLIFIVPSLHYTNALWWISGIFTYPFGFVFPFTYVGSFLEGYFEDGLGEILINVFAVIFFSIVIRAIFFVAKKLTGSTSKRDSRDS